MYEHNNNKYERNNNVIPPRGLPTLQNNMTTQKIVKKKVLCNPVTDISPAAIRYF